MTLLPIFLATLALHWVPQASNTNTSLRGLSVVSKNIVWASGSKGTVLRTLDGGEHWEIRKVRGAETLDFRDVVAFNGNIALIMSSGAGDASRVYLTIDGGVTWKLVLSNPDQTGFFDAMKFWNRQHGILLGDPVRGHFTVFTTADGGLTWTKVNQPAALKEEGAFAASGTCLALYGTREAWFGSGGPGGGRVFHTSDRGQSWTVAVTPLSGQVATAGIFSLKFIDSKHGIAVGGNYKQPEKTSGSLAVTSDNGKAWRVPSVGVTGGFRSGLAYVRQERLLIAVGTIGSDLSFDLGMSWKPFSQDNLNAIANSGRNVWAVGPKGTILKLAFDR
jgi:photosystem II stability/assembly factor-like uncharacterized protein